MSFATGGYTSFDNPANNPFVNYQLQQTVNSEAVNQPIQAMSPDSVTPVLSSPGGHLDSQPSMLQSIVSQDFLDRIQASDFSGMFGKGGGQPIAQPQGELAVQPPVDIPAELSETPIAQSQEIQQPNSLTQALIRSRSAAQNYVRPQAEQMARTAPPPGRTVQPPLMTGPARRR